MTIKIAFGGKMGVGKDSAVDFLISKYNGKKLSFAKPLYDILHYVQEKCGFPIEKDRRFLQFIGTDWAREKDPDIWINLLINSIPEKGNVFLSDLRFPNELTALKNNGWICVKLLRNHHLLNREGTGTVNHSSEILLDNISDSQWDFIIDNNESEEEFYIKIDKLVQKNIL
jgi:hypothetical protein